MQDHGRVGAWEPPKTPEMLEKLGARLLVSHDCTTEPKQGVLSEMSFSCQHGALLPSTLASALLASNSRSYYKNPTA